jgi:tetratricopeptide (TPR) repeat protein
MLVLLAIAQVLTAAPAPAPAAASLDEARFAACIARTDTEPQAAYEEAMAWAHDEKQYLARLCAAEALIQMGRNEEAAKRLQDLSREPRLPPEQRADVLDRAGNAWLLARDPAKALPLFTRAVSLAKTNPDFLIDRARAYAMAAQWRQAEEDLSAALDQRPEDPLALMLRATARMQAGAFELALADAEKAQLLDPKNVDMLLVLGQAKDAVRTRKAP